MLGTIIGMDFPTVTDFKVGFDQGAKAANPDIKILNAVAGTFSDPAKGKEMALAQLGQGADVIFPIAGATGIGALQAVARRQASSRSASTATRRRSLPPPIRPRPT